MTQLTMIQLAMTQLAIAALGLLISAIGSNPLWAQKAKQQEPPPGEVWFERAYNTEKRSPPQASELYRHALALGLLPNLERSSLWRLFYLQQQLGQYSEAFATAWELRGGKEANRQMRRILGKLTSKAAASWQISREAASHYFAGLDLLLRQAPEHRSRFEAALSIHPKKSILQKAILAVYLEYGKEREALYFANIYSHSSAHGELELAELLVRLKRFPQAWEIIAARERYSPKIDLAEQKRIAYLQGRIQQERGQWKQAARSFRIAATQANGNEKSYLTALSAYNLYRIGEKEKALSLMQNYRYAVESDAGLLKLLLKTEVKGDGQAYEKLRAMRYYLEARRSRESSLLIRRAFTLATL